MLALAGSRERCAELTLGACAANGELAVDGRNGFQHWLEDFVCRRLVEPTPGSSGVLGLAQQLLSFRELNDLVAPIKADNRRRQLIEVARALDLRFEFEGLEHLQSVGNRPVILFGNHPTGGGNVFGMLYLLANHFPEYRVLGNRYMGFLPGSSETLIPVDPFSSGAAINMQALVKLRCDFGTKYNALGVFPAGISSRLSLSRGVITDREWSDAFMRIARHHDALLVPVWFSGRNRLRYYLAARIRKELGFLALPAEFLKLRGKTIDVVLGKPISPDVLQHIPQRHGKMSFLRASTYELSREHQMTSVAAQFSAPKFVKSVNRPRPVPALSLGERIEARFIDANAVETAAPWAVDRSADADSSLGADQASYHILLTRQHSSVPLASVQALHWRQLSALELEHVSPIRRSFQLSSGILAAAHRWLEIVRFRATGDFGGRHAWAALGKLAAAMGAQTQIVGLLTAQDANLALASLQLELLQKSCGDELLRSARCKTEILGAQGHHQWRPERDVARIERLTRADRLHLIDPLFRHCARMGVRFGAYGLRAGASPWPCILGRLGGRAPSRLASNQT